MRGITYLWFKSYLLCWKRCVEITQSDSRNAVQKKKSVSSHTWMFNSWTKFILWLVCDVPSNIQGAEIVLFTNYTNMLAAKKYINKCTLKCELEKIMERLHLWFHTNNPVIKITWQYISVPHKIETHQNHKSNSGTWIYPINHNPNL